MPTQTDQHQQSSSLQQPSNVVCSQPANSTAQLAFQGINAFGALVLALLALFGDRIRTWMARPRLHMRCGQGMPFVELVSDPSSQTASQEPPKALHIRLRLDNKGRSSAKNARIYADEYFKKRSDGSKYIKQEMMQRELLWPDARAVDLPPLAPFYVVLAEIRIEEASGPNSDNSLQSSSPVSLFIRLDDTRPGGGFLKIGSGTVVIPLRISAENMKRQQIFYVEIFWNGRDLNQRGPESFGCRLLDERAGEEVRRSAE